MHVNRGPNLFTIAEDIGPTSIMKPARMLPTWVKRWKVVANDAEERSHQWDLAFPSSLKVCLQRFDKDPKGITNAIQDLIMGKLWCRKKEWENEPCCRGSWRQQWSNPTHHLEVEGGHLMLLSWARTLLAEEQQIEVKSSPILEYPSIWAFSVTAEQMWNNDPKRYKLILTSCFPSSPFVTSVLFSSSAPPPILQPFPLSAFKQTVPLCSPTPSGISFRVTSTAHAFLNTSSCCIKPKSASDLTHSTSDLNAHVCQKIHQLAEIRAIFFGSLFEVNDLNKLRTLAATLLIKYETSDVMLSGRWTINWL